MTRTRPSRDAALVLGAAIALGVVIRLLVFRGSGFPSDVATFMAWAERMAEIGPGRFYAPGYFSDYPPGFLYVLWIAGKLFDGEVLRLVVKGLSIPADIAIAILLYRLLRPYAGATTGAVAGAVWMLQPAGIFAGPFWGQVDAWGTLPYLAALVAAGRRRWVWAGVLAAIAGMVKPQFGIVAVVVAAAAAFEFVRTGRWRPLVDVLLSGLVTGLLIALPFGMTPGAFIALVRGASETYPYTSLYAFNGWSIVGDFWKPDVQYVFAGGVLLVVGIAASVAPLWWRRDTAMLLATGAFAAMAFYFLPTRAHERYLYPALALLLPFAVTRVRLVWPYVVMALTFFGTLYFAFTRYEQNGLQAPAILESTIFSRNGQIALALVLMGSALAIVWLLARGGARLEAAEDTPEIGAAPAAIAGPWRLPAGLGPGRPPTKRDVIVALAVALVVVGTRGFRLDQPRDMYFDEVYHARTAFELLAQREPYEWTHPHLAKEIMALSILAFGGDRVETREPAPSGVTAFAVANDGTRYYATDRGLTIEPSRGPTVRATLPYGPARAIALEGADVIVVGEKAMYVVEPDGRVRAGSASALASSPRSLVVAQGRAIVATDADVEIHQIGSNAAPQRVPIVATAMTAGPAGTLYVADEAGAIHVVDAATGRETAKMAGDGRVASLAYAEAAERLYAGRADGAALDWYDPPKPGQPGSGAFGGSVPLSNARTGALSGPVTALALVPRTQFLYALAEGRVVVVETHGASPYASIPVEGTMLGVDGTSDRLVVAGGPDAEIVPTGRHALAWRLPGVLLAGALAFFVVLLASRLFASRAIPVVAGLAVILDGSMFAQARIGMNDVYVGTFLVAGWYFVAASFRPRRSARLDLLIAGILFGLAAASKWAAFYSLAGLGLMSVAITAYAWSRERPGGGGPFDLFQGARPLRVGSRTALLPVHALYLALCFLLIPLAIYVASYVPWYGGTTIPYGWSLWELQQQMYWYHSGLTAPHPAASPWWSWPLVLKPVYWYLGSPGGGQTAVIYDAGNVVLFWAGIVAFGWAVLASIRARSAALALLVFALLTQYVAWIPISRVLFFYHFFTALPFYLLILAAALGMLWERGRRRLVAVYLAIAAAAFVFFYPFISGQPIPADQAAAFYILPTWQYDCQFYPSFRCAIGASAIPWEGVLGRIAIAIGIGAIGVAAAIALEQGALDRLRDWTSRIAVRRGTPSPD